MDWLILALVLSGVVCLTLVGTLLVFGRCLAEAQATVERQDALIEALRREQSQDSRQRFAAVQRLKRTRDEMDRQITALEAGLKVRGGGQAR